MKALTAKDAKYGFGQLVDVTHAEPVAVAKHGRSVVVVPAVEECKRSKAREQVGFEIGIRAMPKNPTCSSSKAK
jgi:prevent-host-death family protein